MATLNGGPQSAESRRELRSLGNSYGKTIARSFVWKKYDKVKKNRATLNGGAHNAKSMG